MAIYYCQECDNYVDNDWNPCEEYKGELICPDCADELKDEDGDNLPNERTPSKEFNDFTPF